LKALLDDLQLAPVAVEAVLTSDALALQGPADILAMDAWDRCWAPDVKASGPHVEDALRVGGHVVLLREKGPVGGGLLLARQEGWQPYRVTPAAGDDLSGLLETYRAL